LRKRNGKKTLFKGEIPKFANFGESRQKSDVGVVLGKGGKGFHEKREKGLYVDVYPLEKRR